MRDVIRVVWTPGGGDEQESYSPQLAGSMLREADEFFDRALMLYLLRSHLRELQASTWAGVATYYSNYFSAVSFIRLHMRSVTQLASSEPPFQVWRIDNATPVFRIRRRGARLGHSRLWSEYYQLMGQMAWPDNATVTDLAPTMAQLRFREQAYRERINYRPGEGFEEIYLSRVRYLRNLKAALMDEGTQPSALPDPAFTDRMGRERLKHLAALLDRLRPSRGDRDIEATCWHRRRTIAKKYARNRSDERFADGLIAGGP